MQCLQTVLTGKKMSTFQACLLKCISRVGNVKQVKENNGRFFNRNILCITQWNVKPGEDQPGNIKTLSLHCINREGTLLSLCPDTLCCWIGQKDSYATVYLCTVNLAQVIWKERRGWHTDLARLSGSGNSTAENHTRCSPLGKWSLCCGKLTPVKNIWAIREWVTSY